LTPIAPLSRRIELINHLKEKGASFVNFTSLQNAMKALDAIKQKAEYGALKISYGKDRCANPPRANNHGAGGSGGGGNGGRNRHASTNGSGDAPQQQQQQQQGASTNGASSDATTTTAKTSGGGSSKKQKKDETDVAELEGALRATALDKVSEDK
jgi:hypothetical protein